MTGGSGSHIIELLHNSIISSKKKDINLISIYVYNEDSLNCCEFPRVNCPPVISYGPFLLAIFIALILKPYKNLRIGEHLTFMYNLIIRFYILLLL